MLVVRVALCVLATATASAWAGSVQGPFTEHFTAWLASAGYADHNFPALHLGPNSSFGGRQYAEESVMRKPVVFIHGNSDGALDNGDEFSSGWSASIAHFLAQGYSSAELYAVTWGDRDLSRSFFRTHSCASLVRVRRFLEAVLKYTGAAKIDVITHSMGVTLGRQVIKGGIVQDDVEVCALGEPLNERISTFIGIAGGNYGLCGCNGDAAAALPACNKMTGFYSGDSCRKVPKIPLTKSNSTSPCSEVLPDQHCKPDYASNLMDLNANTTFKEADYVYSFWSEEDDILGANSVWGRKTSFIPNSNGFFVFERLRHHSLKSETVEHQFKAVTMGLMLP